MGAHCFPSAKTALKRFFCLLSGISSLCYYEITVGIPEKPNCMFRVIYVIHHQYKIRLVSPWGTRAEVDFMQSNLNKKRMNTRQIAVIGMLSAITMVLGSTGMGFIPLPMANATIMHLPVIIGAIVEGPIVGAIIGLIFGLFSIFQNITSPKLLSFAFINPLVSVLPRILVGVIAYYGYRLFSKRNTTLGIGLGAALGSLTNTFGVLTMIYLLYAAQYAAAKNIDPATTAKIIYGIALTNGIPEAIVAVLIVTPIAVAIKRVLKK